MSGPDYVLNFQGFWWLAGKTPSRFFTRPRTINTCLGGDRPYPGLVHVGEGQSLSENSLKVPKGPTKDLTGGKTSAPHPHATTPAAQLGTRRGPVLSYGIWLLGTGEPHLTLYGEEDISQAFCSFACLGDLISSPPFTRQSCRDAYHSGEGEGAVTTVGQLSPA